MADVHVAILRAEDDFAAGSLETVEAGSVSGLEALSGATGVQIRQGRLAGQSDRPAQAQAVLFDIRNWDAAGAKAWLHARGLEFIRFQPAIVVLGGRDILGNPWPSSQAARDAQGT